VTAYPPDQAYPSRAPDLIEPPPILVAAADPAPQRRFTVFFRLILLVPHLILLFLLSIAATVVTFIGWWGALFTARLPRFAVNFLSGCLRWWTRVYAYASLLTDVYPPFTLDDAPAYPVRVAIPEPQRLNRWAVFFRFILAIPASIVVNVISYGTFIIAFIAWLVTLVTGRLPTSFHLAFVATLRFQTRFLGYQSMLTTAYPGELYGDRPGTVTWADAPAPGFEAPAPGYGTPGGYGAPGGYGMGPASQAGTWVLPLTSAARALVTVLIVIGAILQVGAYVLNIEAAHSRSTYNNQAASTAISGVSSARNGLDAS
jgi:uncharacterized protein DUF4389